MAWKVTVGVDPIAQIYDDYCGPACVQMILSSHGLRQLPETALSTFYNSIALWKGPWNYGNPVGVACTINRYNTGGCPESSPRYRPQTEYRVLRTETPYEACARLIHALCARRTASVVMVFGSSHWVVVCGADGDGNASSPHEARFTINGLRIVNPQPMQYGKTPATSVGFERITYEDFLRTYFTGCNDGNPGRPDSMREYGDGREFVLVTHSHAEVPRGRLELPLPETLNPTPVAIEDAVDAYFQSGAEPEPGTENARKPLFVERTDAMHESYYLVPYVEDGVATVLRFDLNGTYLGTAYGIPDRGQFADGRRTVRAEVAKELNIAPDDAALVLKDQLLWQPSVESASPYNPFFRVQHGTDTLFHSIAGQSTRALHDRDTKDALAFR